MRFQVLFVALETGRIFTKASKVPWGPYHTREEPAISYFDFLIYMLNDTRQVRFENPTRVWKIRDTLYLASVPTECVRRATWDVQSETWSSEFVQVPFLPDYAEIDRKNYPDLPYAEIDAPLAQAKERERLRLQQELEEARVAIKEIDARKQREQRRADLKGRLIAVLVALAALAAAIWNL